MTVESRSAWVYRPDVDGLRAIAVSAVLLSHLNIPRMGGGYVGVDVFFVISGYIVAGDLLRRVDEGTHSAGAFYMRRLRRLMPNLIAMVIAVLIAGMVLFLPEDLSRLPRRSLASLAGFANWLFARQAGYFLPASNWNPLLHTWTLSLEVQFYLLAPVLVIAGARLGRPMLRLWVLLIAAASLTFALVTSEPSNPWHFYNTFGRVWEFLLGVALALTRPARIGSRWSTLLCALALVTLGAAFVTLDRDSSFPDIRALVPTLATAILIAYLPTAGPIYRSLSWPPVRDVGKASYSIYIWHWPLIVFTGYLAPGLSEHTAFVPAAITIVLLVALVAYRWIEVPFRAPRLMSNRRFAATLAGALALVAVVSVPIVMTRGLPSRLNSEEQRTLDTEALVSPRRDDCHRGDLTKPLERSCRFGADVAPTVAVWSDSHGAELIQEMSGGLRRRGLAAELLSFSSCPPRWPARAKTDCAQFQRTALEYLLASPTIQTVILAGALDTQQHRSDAEWAREFDLAARTLLAAGKRLVVIYPVPQHIFHVPRALVNKSRYGIEYSQWRTPRSAFLERNRGVYRTYDALGQAGVARVHTADFLCANDSACEVERGGRPLYFDNNHLTLLGARMIAARTLALLAPASPAA